MGVPRHQSWFSNMASQASANINPAQQNITTRIRVNIVTVPDIPTNLWGGEGSLWRVSLCFLQCERCLEEGWWSPEYDLQEGKPIIANSNETTACIQEVIREDHRWMIDVLHNTCLAIVHASCVCVLAPCSVIYERFHMKSDLSLEGSWLMEVKVIRAFWTRLWVTEYCAIIFIHEQGAKPHSECHCYHSGSWHFFQTA